MMDGRQHIAHSACMLSRAKMYDFVNKKEKATLN